MPSLAEVRAQLTGPGGMFELVTEDVLGRPLPVYKQRMRSLREIPQAAIQRGDDTTYLVYGDRSYGFRSFVERGQRRRPALADRCGIGPGDRVAVLSQNNPEWCLTFWATVASGAVLVGLNGWWKTDEILYGLQDSGATVLVADGKRFERIADRLDEAPDLAHVFLVDAEPRRLHAAPGAGVRSSGSRTWGPSPPPSFPDAAIAEDDDAVIFYTSGTTGKPKGAISTHRSMLANLQNTMYSSVAGAMANPTGASVLPSGTGQTVSLLTSPLFHVSGCHSNLVVGLLAGIKIVIPEGRFQPDKVLELIQDHGVNIWATVPTMVWRVCEFPGRHDYDTSSVTSVAFGGSPSADELQRKVGRHVPQRGLDLQRLRPDRDLVGRHGHQRRGRQAQAVVGRTARARRRGPHRRPAEPAPAPGRDRRGVHPRRDPHEGLLEQARGHGRGHRRRRLAAHGRHRPPRRRGLPRHHRPQEGHDHPGRREHLLRRDREPARPPPGGRRRRHHRRPPPRAGRGGQGRRAGRARRSRSPRTTCGPGCASELADFKVPAYVEIRTEPLPRNASGKLLKNVLRGEGEVSFAETM